MTYLPFDYNAKQVYLHIYFDGEAYYGKLCNTQKLREPFIQVKRVINYNRTNIITEKFWTKSSLIKQVNTLVSNLMPSCNKINQIETKAPLHKLLYNKLKSYITN